MIDQTSQRCNNTQKAPFSVSCDNDRSFSVAGPCLWNSLPVALRDRDISLVQSRDFWTHFGFCRAAAHSDCSFFCAVFKYFYLLTFYLLKPFRPSAGGGDASPPLDPPLQSLKIYIFASSVLPRRQCCRPTSCVGVLFAVVTPGELHRYQAKMRI